MVNSATGTQPFGPGPITAALMVGAKPPSAKPICVPMAMPDRRTRVSNISPYSAGQTPFAALYTTPDSSRPNVKTSAMLLVLSAHMYGQISTAEPSAPRMKTGRRPMRSDSVAHNGIATSASTLASTSTVSIVARGMCIVLTAYDSVKTLKIVLTTDTSAAKITRTTSTPWRVKSSTTGSLGVTCFFTSSANAGVSGSVRRTQKPTATTIALRKNGMRQPHASNWSSGSAEIGMNTRVARISPACVPDSVKLVKNARRWAGACSSVIELAPACSPEAEMPCSSRRITSMIGEATPI